MNKDSLIKVAEQSVLQEVEVLANDSQLIFHDFVVSGGYEVYHHPTRDDIYYVCGVPGALYTEDGWGTSEV